MARESENERSVMIMRVQIWDRSCWCRLEHDSADKDKDGTDHKSVQITDYDSESIDCYRFRIRWWM